VYHCGCELSLAYEVSSFRILEEREREWLGKSSVAAKSKSKRTRKCE